jgi:hypothetical protein
VKGPAVPVLLDLALIAVGVGSLLLLRLAGGSMPWGQLMIAVGPDGRPMRARVRWHLWSVSHGEPPWRAALAGLVSIALGGASLMVALPLLVDSLFHAVRVPIILGLALTFVVATACVLVPLGMVVLLRAALDLTARRSSMVGQVVGLRRDTGLFGRSYHLAVQPGDRVLGRGLWAEAFPVNRATFEQLCPGDRVGVEYSPNLRHVYRAWVTEAAARGLSAAR